jgi:hypothetical protein
MTLGLEEDDIEVVKERCMGRPITRQKKSLKYKRFFVQEKVSYIKVFLLKGVQSHNQWNVRT